MSILIIEDDRDLVELLVFSLKRTGLNAVGAHDVPAAWRLFEAERPEVVVLDVNLGAWNGLQFLSELRQRSTVPVILVTARDAEADKVHGLESGADDYLTKPFSHREFVARVRALLRRVHATTDAARVTMTPTDDIQAGPLRLDTAQQRILLDNVPLRLSPLEVRILRFLMLNRGNMVRPAALADHLWGQASPDRLNVVRVVLNRLRQKLPQADVDAQQPLLRVVPRVGVVLLPEASA